MDIKHIVVTTDLSENAEAAVPLAAELSRKFNARIQLVHVFEDLAPYVVAEGMLFDVPEMIATLRRQRQLNLNELAARITHDQHVAVDPVLLDGQPVKEILKFLRDSNADCVVLATHGHTGVARFMLGSVAEKIVRSAACPVFTVPSAAVPVDAISAHGVSSKAVS